MRLYLSSYQFGNHPEKLAKLASGNKKATVIMNAVDFGDKERKSQNTQNQIQQLVGLGFEASELDLRNYFGKEEVLEKYLREIGLVWIHGGNAFILQRAFAQSGFRKIIKEMVVRDQIVYAGFSAAVCVITPTLHGAELVDDPTIVPEGYEEKFSWDGLRLINYNVAVHYQSDHPESADVDKEVAYFKKNGIPYRTLKDGEVIVVDGKHEVLLH